MHSKGVCLSRVPLQTWGKVDQVMRILPESTVGPWLAGMVAGIGGTMFKYFETKGRAAGRAKVPSIKAEWSRPTGTSIETLLYTTWYALPMLYARGKGSAVSSRMQKRVMVQMSAWVCLLRALSLAGVEFDPLAKIETVLMRLATAVGRAVGSASVRKGTGSGHRLGGAEQHTD